MRKWLRFDRVLVVLAGTLLFSIVIGLVLYGLLGHPLIETLYKSESIGIVNKIMAGRAVIPLEEYYRAADRIMQVGTLRMGTALLALTALILWIRHRQLLVKLSISIVAFVVLLVIAELASRFAFLDITTTGDNRSYFATRWQRKVRKNTWGFRERDFDPNKPEGVYRITVIGDSITYGQGIEEKERFANLLEKQLVSQNGKHKYEVLNFGRPGAETGDHLEILRDPVLGVKPDFILLQWYTNDVEVHNKRLLPARFRPAPSDVLLSWLRKTSALFYLLNSQWTAIQQNLGWLRNYQEPMIERFGDANSASSVAAKESLRRFIHVCKEHGLPLGIVLFSDSYQNDSPKLDFLTERVLELCKQEAIVCLDLRSTLSPYKHDSGFLVNRLDRHPGPLANRLAADSLWKTFGKVWLRQESRGRSR